jgi:hypothetical protein
MNVVDALSCPYCDGPLFKESYYFRCERDHRFTSSVSPRAGSPAGSPDDPPAGGTGHPPPPEARSLVLQVIWHSNRQEIGRRYAFSLEEDEA